ncbi:hypothetical protein ACFYW6_27065 [Streptomyces sp. NPDC002659]|uniref:hypothetical protein n=1 Tax=Streptomyces sp. NPDC002659 TaxID=3364656 RepID=UPI0036BFAEF3
MTTTPESPYVQPLCQHPALDGWMQWPSIRMWVRRDGMRLDIVSLAPAREARTDFVLLPCDEEVLVLLGQIAACGSRASLYVTHLNPAYDKRLVLCGRRATGAVRVHGSVPMVRDRLYTRTRTAMLNVASVHRTAGRSDAAVVWSALARRILVAKRTANKAGKGRSVRAVSGGLPTLGLRN